MNILRVDNRIYIKPEIENQKPDELTSGFWIWGYRWNKNEQRWGKYCIAYSFKKYEWVDGNVVDTAELK